MPARVVIVGGMREQPDRVAVISALSRRHPEVNWDWVQPVTPAYNLPAGPFRRLLHELRTAEPQNLPRIVKLFHIHGRDENALYQTRSPIVLAPVNLETEGGLIEWLGSSEAGLVPVRSWTAPIREVGMLAILAKLVRNKSWNKDVQGHNWTKEHDLLGQSPVFRPTHPAIYREAVTCLTRAAGSLLLEKGGSKTPKEWSIHTDHVPLAKRALIERSIDSLGEAGDLLVLYRFIQDGPGQIVAVDEVIVSERVLAECRNR